tara:strand:+ start:1188 stop:1595 length:408 start_codon:yes stop_codon:yes gene_type:complete
MGLDQYAYAVPEKESESRKELAYWRKHNRLQGWMEQLWYDKGRPNAQTDGDAMGDFNCVDLELDANDIDALEEAIENFALPETQGFFFGEDSYLWESEGSPSSSNYFHKEEDLRFIEEAKKSLDKGEKVVYHCWY